MRARMALHYAGIEWEHREIELKNKPAQMLEISPKGTVPVLLLENNQVIDESLDIMLWALSQNDPERWLPDLHRDDIFNLIEQNDTIFKPALDRYKYPNRYPDEDCSNARDDGLKILEELNRRIANNGALSGNKNTLADYTIFPFIRQFAHVDKDWFNDQPIPDLRKWFNTHINSKLFTAIMEKHPIYT